MNNKPHHLMKKMAGGDNGPSGEMTHSASALLCDSGSMVTMAESFRKEHQRGCFVMPNPWDRGSARILESMGFVALATTSAGHGRSIGKDDQQVTRNELITHVRELTSVIGVPLNVDGERLFPDAPGGIAETVARLADAGAAGISIEDYDPVAQSITSRDDAVKNVEIAVRAAASWGLVVTARAENHLYDAGDLDDTITRLQAYQDAGADVLYAPGLIARNDIERVVGELERPLNVLLFTNGPCVEELAVLGVRRVSLGSALFNHAYDALREKASGLTRADPHGRSQPLLD